MPIHRHKKSSETCICVRGHLEEYFYDSDGQLTETVDMVPDGGVLNIEKGQWHSLKCLASGTVLGEAKDGEYRVLEEDEVWKGKNSNEAVAFFFGNSCFKMIVNERYLRYWWR